MLVEELKGTEGKLIATCHDEIILEAPESQAEHVAGILKITMEAAGAEFLHSVPVFVEVNVGDSWAIK